MVRAHGPRPVRDPPPSTWSARATASGVGGDLSSKLRGSWALVGAEIARVEGRPLAAMDLYERAIMSARANGFVHNEALAYELAARFYAARGFNEVAHLYLGNARRGYLRWGADGKVRQLDQLYRL